MGDEEAAGPAEGRAAVRAAGCSGGWPRRGLPGPRRSSAPSAALLPPPRGRVGGLSHGWGCRQSCLPAGGGEVCVPAEAAWEPARRGPAGRGFQPVP